MDEVREEKEVTFGPDLLVGSVKAATRAEILASLPPKEVSDKLIHQYFQTSDMGSCELLHIVSFRFIDVVTQPCFTNQRS